MGEVIFHVVLIVIMGIFAKESFAISTGRSADPIGPAGFPQVLLGIILILLIISLFNSFRKLKANKQNEKLNINIAYFGLLIGIILFILLNDFISFTLATIAFCFFLFYLLGQKKYLKMSINSVIIAVAFTLVFGNVLSVPLPRGIGLIKELSYFLY